MKLYMEPGPDNAGGVGGVAQVCKALHQHLPDYDISFTDEPSEADVIAVHVSIRTDKIQHFDVYHMHGFHWTGDDGHWAAPDHHVNSVLAGNLQRYLRAVTIPSQWAAQILRRDCRLHPRVIPNGISLADWQSQPLHEAYALWNKYRIDNLCRPEPAYELAQRGAPVVSTFAPKSTGTIPHNMVVTGRVPFDRMKPLIQKAGVYLSTTKETDSVSMLEALASGVPVLGYDWGGTRERIQHGITGWLVEPGDYDGLATGYHWLMEHRHEISRNCIDYVQAYDWQALMPQYVELYRQVYEQKRTASHGVACIVTCHNYGHWLAQCLDSILNQTRVPDEIVVVDDGSTDDTAAVAQRYADRVRLIRLGFNQGIARAVNAGIAATTQPYVFHMAADDTLHPRYVETLHTALCNDPTLAIAYCNLRKFDDSGTAYKPYVAKPFDFDRLAAGENMVMGTALHRRDIWERVGGYQDTISRGNSRACDYHFWLRTTAMGARAALVSQEPLYNYRQHGDSVSQSHPLPDLSVWLPWMHDKDYPFAAPARKQPLARSYDRTRVTVVIPVGTGHERYLPTALESLLGQTYRDWHVIVVDDTLYGISPAILVPYPFCQVIRTKGCEGAGRARNIGLSHVQSELLVWLDADDYLMPGAIQSMVKGHGETGRYVFGHSLFLDGDTSYVKPVSPYHQRAMLHETRHLVTVLMRTADARAVGGFDETMQSMEVRDFFARCAVAGVCGHLIPHPLVGYRLDAGTRRRYLDDHKTELVGYFDSIYSTYKEGKKEMACCGGKSAKPASTARSFGGATVRMCYTGNRKGTTRYNGLKGRTYQFSASPSHKCKDVHPDDVEVLLQRSGHLRVITPTVQRSAPQEPAPPPLPVVPETPVETHQEPEPEPPVIPDEQPANDEPDTELDGDTEEEAETSNAFYFTPPRKRGRPRKNAS